MHHFIDETVPIAMLPPLDEVTQCAVDEKMFPCPLILI